LYQRAAARLSCIYPQNAPKLSKLSRHHSPGFPHAGPSLLRSHGQAPPYERYLRFSGARILACDTDEWERAPGDAPSRLVRSADQHLLRQIPKPTVQPDVLA
jgi:hypothetical protein